MYLKSNATDEIKRKPLLMYIKRYFLKFFRIDIADQITLFKVLLPPPKGGGELVFDDKMTDPIHGLTHGLVGQPWAR